MTIPEPLTVLTDYLLAAVTIYFALALIRAMGSHNQVCGWLWAASFLCSAVGAIAGGSFHLLSGQQSENTRNLLWNLFIFSVGASLGLMVGGTHAAYIKKKHGSVKWLISGIAVTILALAIRASGFPRFADFNQNDAFHVVQIAAYYCLFRFARLLKDRRSLNLG